jgi:hypothetical protein
LLKLASAPGMKRGAAIDAWYRIPYEVATCVAIPYVVSTCVAIAHIIASYISISYVSRTSISVTYITVVFRAANLSTIDMT